jgi:polyisoprenoid-binding protein YceI
MRAILILAFVVCARSANAATFELNEHDGTIYAQIWKNRHTIAQAQSHDHVIVASKWQASVTYDPTGAAPCAIKVTLPVASLVVDPPELRKKVGYDTILSDKDRATVDAHMRDKDQLDAAHFTEMQFVSKECSAAGEGKVEVKGSLSIRGKSKDVVVPLRIKINGDKLEASGTVTVTHKDFGFSPYSGFLGAVKNGEDIKLTIAIGQ